MEQVGRYRILGVLGRGGAGTVYRAFDPRLNRVVVLKVLRPEFADTRFYQQRFHREAQASSRLHHPNIVTVYEVGEADGLFYQVMEYVEGRSLREVMGGPPPHDPDYGIEIIRQVGAALGYAHESGVVHGDIKPENILLSKDNRVVLTDFGLARGPGEASLTEIGTVMGTWGYVSPEQAMGRPVDARSDLFSLGIVLYEVLTGQLPFGGPPSIVHENPVPPEQLNPAVPPAVGAVVLKALEKDPDLRYQSAADFVFALLDASAVVPSVHREAQIPPAAAAPVWRAAGWRWSLTAFFLGVVGLAIFEKRVFGHEWVGIALVLIVLSIAFSLILSRWRPRAFTMISVAPTPTDTVTPKTLPAPPPTRETVPQDHDQATQEGLPYVPPPVAATQLVQREPSAMAWLLVLNGPHRGRQFRLKDRVTIGRTPTCDVVLDDESWSREHATVYLKDDRFHVMDQGSSNGTLLNGVQTQTHELRDRDEIQIGKTIMLFIQAASPEDLTAEAKRRLREFDSVWEQLTRSVRHDG